MIFRNRGRVLGLLVFLVGRLGRNDMGGGKWMWGKSGGEKDDLENNKTNPSFTSTLTFLNKYTWNPHLKIMAFKYILMLFQALANNTF